MFCVRVRLNVFGNYIMTQTLSVPHIWEGYRVCTDPKAEPWDSAANLELRAITYVVSTGNGSGGDYYRADGFPVGAPGATGKALQKALEGRGWVMEEKK